MAGLVLHRNPAFVLFSHTSLSLSLSLSLYLSVSLSLSQLLDHGLSAHYHSHYCIRWISPAPLPHTSPRAAPDYPAGSPSVPYKSYRDNGRNSTSRKIPRGYLHRRCAAYPESAMGPAPIAVQSQLQSPGALRIPFSWSSQHHWRAH